MGDLNETEKAPLFATTMRQEPRNGVSWGILLQGVPEAPDDRHYGQNGRMDEVAQSCSSVSLLYL